MNVFRLARKKYKIELSGKGAAKSGNRWNSKGTEIIYCADSRALTVAEVAVHLSIATLPDDFVMLEIRIPSSIKVKSISQKKLPSGWNDFPHNMESQSIGDQFIEEGKYAVLKVPSAVVQGDFNFLINPQHKSFSKIKIIAKRDFPFDKRLVD